VVCARGPGAIDLWQAKPESGGREHDRYAPGLHHFAFSAESRADVDHLHALLVDKCIAVTDPPAEYPDYLPDYYAVFFADPDGLNFELVHAILPA
jgi:glyoxylase I family protein